jgi:hypothetical protein
VAADDTWERVTMMRAVDTTRMKQRRSAWLVTLAMMLSVLFATGSAQAQTDERSVCDADAEVAIAFTDVAPDSVFCVEIGEFAASGLTVGREDGTFGPGESVTRGAMAAFLHRLAGSPDGPFDDPGFSDVDASSTFATEIAWLATTGITVGRDDGTFGPDGTVTRGAMAAFLHRLAGSPDGPFDDPEFSDVDAGSTFAAEIAWLATTGITVGRDDGTFAPGGTVSRGAMAAFLTRYLAADLPILPPPPPEPVTVDLFVDSDAFLIDVGGGPPTGTGGSAEGEVRAYGFGLRSYAWHGQNASARAEGKIERVVSAEAVLEDMPEQVIGVTAEVSYALDAQAEVKGPWDRSSTFVVTVADLRASGGTTLTSLTKEDDDANPTQRTGPGTLTGSLTTTFTRDSPQGAFIVRGSCTSSSGSQLFAFFNEGYCDALDQGGVELRALSVTFTPILEE